MLAGNAPDFKVKVRSNPCLFRQRNPPGVGRVAGISQGIVQHGIGVLLHAAVGQADVAGVDVDVLRPTDALAGDEFEDSIFRVALARDVPVSIKKSLGKFIVCLKTDKVADVLIFQTNEVDGGNARVRRTNQDFRRASLIRNDLKMPERVRAGVKFLCAAVIR